MNGPCSPSVSGKARRASCTAGVTPPGRRPVSCMTAASTVRRSASGASAVDDDHGTTNGRLVRVPARSPSTSTASTGVVPSPPYSCASRCAEASPAVPPLVDASTSVRPSVRPPSTRANSNSAAVPDSSARAPRPSASRCATTRTRRLEKPARSPTTVSSCLLPSAVWAVNERTPTRKPFARSVAPTRCATSRSPAEPGRRRGAAVASASSWPKAAAPSNASGASEVVSGRGGSRSEKPASTSANRIGRNPAR